MTQALDDMFPVEVEIGSSKCANATARFAIIIAEGDRSQDG
ncbi:hypothetical protein A7A08_01866 [Methyloligella halotolerans]|uniref:Uncharacterized protein n=1 Tax=Methyloligella halotolerans TaxID=1177755 RepID=A0A1E2RY93_9HYPH|nr:hypothetical protein A7A08_01866 [Methyloligella halotolerans]